MTVVGSEMGVDGDGAADGDNHVVSGTEAHLYEHWV